MLSTKKEKKKAQEPGIAQNRINEGTILKGDITSTGFFRIDGHIEGNVKTPSKVVLGKTGRIIGTLSCENADVEGKIEGSVEVSGTLTLRASGVIDGDVTVGKLAVETGATMNASCVMLDCSQKESAPLLKNEKSNLFKRQERSKSADIQRSESD
jgi:cytoskeletal protein CcmA (bactofilin family)